MTGFLSSVKNTKILTETKESVKKEYRDWLAILHNNADICQEVWVRFLRL
jgi:hypothetical protein